MGDRSVSPGLNSAELCPWPVIWRRPWLRCRFLAPGADLPPPDPATLNRHVPPAVSVGLTCRSSSCTWTCFCQIGRVYPTPPTPTCLSLCFTSGVISMDTSVSGLNSANQSLRWLKLYCFFRGVLPLLCAPLPHTEQVCKYTSGIWKMPQTPAPGRSNSAEWCKRRQPLLVPWVFLYLRTRPHIIPVSLHFLH